MQSKWNDAEAARFVAARPGVAEALALRTYSARLLGAEGALVLHGGGNTSAKGRAETLLGESVDVLWVKGSGWDLATIEAPGHPALRLEALRALRARSAMSDEEMVNALRLALLDAAAPTPSIETLLHAYLPARFVDHTHADAVLAVADQPDAQAICRTIYGPGLVWVPYVMPGFTLALRCAEAFEAAQAPTVIVLERHGIFTFGDSAKESYVRMIEAVTLAERYIGDRRKTVSVTASVRDRGLEQQVLPRLRGAVARQSGAPIERGPILSVRSSDRVLAFLQRKDAQELSQIGCATPDHVIRTKPVPLFLTPGEDVESEVRAFGARYDAYFAQMTKSKSVTRTKLDPWPRVVLVPKVGIVTVAATKREAEIAADIYEHTIDVIVDASDVGSYTPVPRSDLFDIEYWSLEQAKLKKSEPKPLAGAVAFVTGAASGIGRASSARMCELGAHVMLVDRDADALARAHGELSARYKAQTVAAACDVTSDAQVKAALATCVGTFGGVDVVLSNAGTAPEGMLHTEGGDEALRASLDVNLLAHNVVARAATEILLAQGHGGCLLFNASKAAFNPGPGFGPYAVAKTALLGLMRQYALDLGKQGIRANAVNADRIRTGLFADGVLESRAKARGLSADAYFRANLLEREVTGFDVADAFAWLATARATTGCVITVDGGNAAAFPR
jgi:rhamnose utilization protein RhaD (predicted bifunctional aldolase and dehydrogenase)/NAD(P)-dependent dehydrogenase (short-subunit alcohol dehydrogenase family)